MAILKKKNIVFGKRLMVFSVSALCTLSAHTLQATSLDEVMAVTYETNPNLMAERYELRAVAEQLPQAYAGWMPTVVASYAAGEEVEKRPPTTVENSRHPVTEQITYDHNLFDGFQTTNDIKRAWATVRAAIQNYQSVEQSVLGATVQAYVDLVRAREIVDLSVNNERVLSEQLDAARDRFELGEATRTDVAQAESRLSRAESDRIDSEGDLVSSEAEFRRITGINPPEKVYMPTMLPTIPDEIEMAMEVAQEYNPSMLQSKYAMDAARYQVGLAKGALYPSFDFEGSVSEQRNASGLASVGRKQHTKSATVTLTVPLFQSGAEYSLVRQRKREAEAAGQSFNDLRNITRQNVTSAWRDIETAKSTIKAQSASVAAAEIALEGVKEEREVGARTTLDVLDAEQELFVARVNLVGAQRNEVIATYALISAMGLLTANDLGLDVTLFEINEYIDRVKYKFVGLD